MIRGINIYGSTIERGMVVKLSSWSSGVPLVTICTSTDEPFGVALTDGFSNGSIKILRDGFEYFPGIIFSENDVLFVGTTNGVLDNTPGPYYLKVATVTQTDEVGSTLEVRLAEDVVAIVGSAIEGVIDTSLDYNPIGPVLSRAALTGDVSAPQGSNSTTLATVNSDIGTFGSSTQVPVITVNAKGLVTAVTNTAISFPSTTLAAVSAASTTSGNSLYTMTSAVPVEFRTSGGTSLLYLDESNGRVGIGTALPSAILHSLSTSEQLRLGYNVSNAVKFTVSSANSLSITPLINSSTGVNFTKADGTALFNINTTNNWIHFGPISVAPLAIQFTTNPGGNGVSSGKNLAFYSYNVADDATEGNWHFGGGSYSRSTGNQYGIVISKYFTPTSGTSTFSWFGFKQTINQTGSSSGASRSIYNAPILTSAANYYFIESTNGRVKLTDTYSAGSGSKADSTLEILPTWNTSGTPTAIKLNVTDTASNASSLLMDLQVGGTSKFKVSKTGLGTFADDVVVPDEAYGISWNGSNEVPTKNAVYDQMELKSNIASPTFTGAVTAPTIVSTGVVRLKNYTVATLPAGTQGDVAYVTDALLPMYLATVVGGGAVVVPVFYDGTSWVCH